MNKLVSNLEVYIYKEFISTKDVDFFVMKSFTEWIRVVSNPFHQEYLFPMSHMFFSHASLGPFTKTLLSK